MPEKNTELEDLGKKLIEQDKKARYKRIAEQQGRAHNGFKEMEKRAAEALKKTDDITDDVVDDVVKKFDWKKFCKYGAIGLGIAILAGVGIWAAKKIKENNEEKANEAKAPELPVLDDNIEIDDTEIEVNDTIPNLDTTVVIPPMPLPGGEEKTPGAAEDDDKVVGPEGKDDKAAKAEEKDDKAAVPGAEDKGTITVDGKKYVVKKGDCVWNIAKKLLTEEKNGVKPTNAEIARKTKEIMTENNLKYANKNGLVIIHPDQELKVA